MSEPVTVVIPVGPSNANRYWLNEALDSVFAQTAQPAQTLLLFDRGPAYDKVDFWTGVESWLAPWRMGVAAMFNMGVGLATNDQIFLMGSDDELDPHCIEYCLETWESNKRRDAYYYVGVHYMDGRGDQDVPCGAAMVTRNLWKQTGGFPPETASGASDAGLISMLMVHRPDALVKVADGRPLYNYRSHPDTDTAQRGPWQGVILQTRDILTQQGFAGREINDC